jgi:hypothetical protein
MYDKPWADETWSFPSSWFPARFADASFLPDGGEPWEPPKLCLPEATIFSRRAAAIGSTPELLFCEESGRPSGALSGEGGDMSVLLPGSLDFRRSWH